MSFVPLTGPATFRAGEPPRAGTIEFTDGAGGRAVALPVRAALPVLSRSRTADDAHPSVVLLSSAALLALRFVAAGKVAPSASGVPGWRVDGLDDRDRDSVERLARARAYDELDATSATTLVREVLDAVADTVPRAAPAPASRPSERPAGVTSAT